MSLDPWSSLRFSSLLLAYWCHIQWMSLHGTSNKPFSIIVSFFLCLHYWLPFHTLQSGLLQNGEFLIKNYYKWTDISLRVELRLVIVIGCFILGISFLILTPMSNQYPRISKLNIKTMHYCYIVHRLMYCIVGNFSSGRKFGKLSRFYQNYFVNNYS